MQAKQGIYIQTFSIPSALASAFVPAFAPSFIITGVFVGSLGSGVMQPPCRGGGWKRGQEWGETQELSRTAG